MKKHTTLKSKFNAAFSLVELLVVIAVIAVIAAIAIPNITGAREAAVAAQTDYDQATVDRILAQALAAGATSDGTDAGDAPTADALRAGDTFQTAEGVVFSLQTQ
jgi:type IV pilus assembly protein PilA